MKNQEIEKAIELLNERIDICQEFNKNTISNEKELLEMYDELIVVLSAYVKWHNFEMIFMLIALAVLFIMEIVY